MHRLTVICWLALLLGWLPATNIRIAVAHAEYERAEPAADSVVETAPTQVQIWFTQELFRRQGVNRIEVTDATGVRVEQGDATIDDDDRTLMTVSLAPDLADGVYTVRWVALSAEDGHEGEGEFHFTIATGTTTGASAVTTTTVSVTAVLTSTVPSPTPAASATPTTVPTVAAADPTVAPTSTVPPAAPTTNLPCLGGAAPLALALGAIVVRRRRG